MAELLRFQKELRLDVSCGFINRGNAGTNKMSVELSASEVASCKTGKKRHQRRSAKKKAARECESRVASFHMGEWLATLAAERRGHGRQAERRARHGHLELHIARLNERLAALFGSLAARAGALTGFAVTRTRSGLVMAHGTR